MVDGTGLHLAPVNGRGGGAAVVDGAGLHLAPVNGRGTAMVDISFVLEYLLLLLE